MLTEVELIKSYYWLRVSSESCTEETVMSDVSLPNGLNEIFVDPVENFSSTKQNGCRTADDRGHALL
jgi:hypothetical protein